MKYSFSDIKQVQINREEYLNYSTWNKPPESVLIVDLTAPIGSSGLMG